MILSVHILLYPHDMYICSTSMTVDNYIKNLILIYSFIVLVQKLTLSLKDYSLNSHFFRVYNPLSAVL